MESQMGLRWPWCLTSGFWISFHKAQRNLAGPVLWEIPPVAEYVQSNYTS